MCGSTGPDPRGTPAGTAVDARSRRGRRLPQEPGPARPGHVPFLTARRPRSPAPAERPWSAVEDYASCAALERSGILGTIEVGNGSRATAPTRVKIAGATPSSRSGRNPAARHRQRRRDDAERRPRGPYSPRCATRSTMAAGAARRSACTTAPVPYADRSATSARAFLVGRGHDDARAVDRVGTSVLTYRSSSLPWSATRVKERGGLPVRRAELLDMRACGRGVPEPIAIGPEHRSHSRSRAGYGTIRHVMRLAC